mmetsp:Transcript_6928/g.13831  ORF Transcript_6928/g.13831 Transcript_6928/m.13831 type:complete len:90 (+) Transcript_6928:272-541(+)
MMNRAPRSSVFSFHEGLAQENMKKRQALLPSSLFNFLWATHRIGNSTGINKPNHQATQRLSSSSSGFDECGCEIPRKKSNCDGSPPLIL